ncbi:MAG: hypothetical protein OEZ13_11830 [Spirochaetia bacterium]|nr:hypothetical protein [Spirochaetia bacterium]
MKIIKNKFTIGLFILLLIGLSSSVLYFQNQKREKEIKKSEPIGVISYKQNKVFKKYPENFAWEDARTMMNIFLNDSIKTDENSSAVIKLKNTLTLEPMSNTNFDIAIVKEKIGVNFKSGSMALEIKKGESYAKIGENRFVKIKDGRVFLNKKDDILEISSEKGGVVYYENGKEEFIPENSQTTIAGKAKPSVKKHVISFIKPEDGAYFFTEDKNISIDFEWKTDLDIKSYEIILSKTKDFEDPVVIKTDKVKVFQANLKTGDWFVKIRDTANKEENVSALRVFHVVKEEKIKTYEPKDRQVILDKDGKVKFEWESPKDDEPVEIKIAKDPAFFDVVSKKTTESENHTVEKLKEGDYYWKVQKKTDEEKTKTEPAAKTNYFYLEPKAPDAKTASDDKITLETEAIQKNQEPQKPQKPAEKHAKKQKKKSSPIKYATAKTKSKSKSKKKPYYKPKSKKEKTKTVTVSKKIKPVQNKEVLPKIASETPKEKKEEEKSFEESDKKIITPEEEVKQSIYEGAAEFERPLQQKEDSQEDTEQIKLNEKVEAQSQEIIVEVPKESPHNTGSRDAVSIETDKDDKDNLIIQSEIQKDTDTENAQESESQKPEEEPGKIENLALKSEESLETEVEEQIEEDESLAHDEEKSDTEIQDEDETAIEEDGSQPYEEESFQVNEEDSGIETQSSEEQDAKISLTPTEEKQEIKKDLPEEKSAPEEDEPEEEKYEVLEELPVEQNNKKQEILLPEKSQTIKNGKVKPVKEKNNITRAAKYKPPKKVVQKKTKIKKYVKKIDDKTEKESSEKEISSLEKPPKTQTDESVTIAKLSIEAPENMAPAGKKIELIGQGKTLTLSWNKVKNANEYRIRVYQKLKNKDVKKIVERRVSENQYTIKNIEIAVDSEVIWEVVSLITSDDGSVIKRSMAKKAKFILTNRPQLNPPEVKEVIISQ